MPASSWFLNPVSLILFGLIVGVFSGVMGLGGGAIMIPMMVLALGLTQQEAQGTSLAVMIPPVTLPAVIRYYRGDNVRLDVAVWMCVGVAVASYFGADLANRLPKDLMRLIFGFVLIYIAAYTVFGKEHLTRTMLLSLAVTAVAVLAYLATRWLDARVV